MSRRDVDPGAMPDDIDAFLAALRADAGSTAAPSPGDALATLFLEGSAPVAAPSATGARRRWTRVAVAGVAAGAFGFVGLGAAGALPGPVQDTVADLAEVIGIDLPRADPEPTPPTTTTTTTTSSAPEVVPPVTADGPTTPATPLPAEPAPTRPDEPGRSEDAPGHDEDGPGRSEDAPGRNAEAPGRSGDAPGRIDDVPGRPIVIPSTVPAQRGGGRRDAPPSTVPDRGRNPDHPIDVHPSDRTGPEPRDHGGPNR